MSEKEVNVKKCDVCHVEKDSVEKCLDPYEADVNGNEVEVKLCAVCYQLLCDDI